MPKFKREEHVSPALNLRNCLGVQGRLKHITHAKIRVPGWMGGPPCQPLNARIMYVFVCTAISSVEEFFLRGLNAETDVVALVYLTLGTSEFSLLVVVVVVDDDLGSPGLGLELLPRLSAGDS